jgi:hypothetical protein
VQTSPRLSSSITLASKWILLAGSLLTCLIWIYQALGGPAEFWIFAIFWGIAFAITAILSRSTKVVTIEGDHFIISNGFTRHRVPIAHLVYVTESHLFRGPTLILGFDPPTPFGKRVRVITPMEFFSHKRFHEIAAFLRSLTHNREHL